MSGRRRLWAVGGVVAVALLLLLATCSRGGDRAAPRTGGAPTGGAPSAGAATGTPSAQLREPVASVEAEVLGGTVRLDVQPLVRTPSATVLTAVLTVVEAPEGGSLTLGDAFAARGAGGNRFDLSDVRLFAPDGGLLAGPATSAGAPATSSLSRAPGLRQGQSAGLRVVFPTLPGAVATADLLWPLLGALPGLPVEDGEVPELPPYGEEEPRDADLTGAQGDAQPVSARSSELAGAVRTEQAPERTRVVLAADVLFALDSAELSASARVALDRGAAQVQAAGPGPVRITGHTDDQGSDAYNRDLSKRRAQAVADALAGDLPPAQYPPRVEGRGESEPAVEGTSRQARAANRRVELLVERPQTKEPEPASTALPPGGGPTASADEGLVLTQSDGSRLRIAAPGAQREGDWLRVDLTATVESSDGGTTDLLVDLRDATRGVKRADASGIGVLDGGTLLLPAVDADGTCACSNTLFGLSAVAGEQRRIAVWVQAPSTSASSVTVQLPLDQVRLLDVPVR